MAGKKGIISTFIDSIGRVFRGKPSAPEAKKAAGKPAKESPPSRREQIVEETRLKLERLEEKEAKRRKQPGWVKELDEQKKSKSRIPPREEFLKPMFHKKTLTPKEEIIVDKKPEGEVVKKEVPKKPAARKRSKFERSLGVEKGGGEKAKPARKARAKRTKRKTKKKADETKKSGKKNAITLPKIEPKPIVEKMVPAKKPIVEKPGEENIEDKPKEEKVVMAPKKEAIVEKPKVVKGPSVERPAPAVARAEPIRQDPIYRGDAIIVSQIEEFDEQITITKELIKSLNMDFFKRRITEDEYRRKTLEYRERMKLLEIRRRNLLKAQSGKPRIAAQDFAPVTAAETKKAVSQTTVHQILRAKAMGKIDDERLSELENKVTELAKRYNLSEQELEQNVLNIDTSKTLESFNKLVSLIDLEREANKRLNQVRIVGVPKAFKESAKEVEIVKGIATEIKKHRIVTDFDKIVAIVGQRGKLKLSELSAQLKINKKACAGLLSDLEDEGLLELKYPAFGEVAVQIPGYDEMQKALKEKEKAEEKAKKLQEKEKARKLQGKQKKKNK